VLAHGDCASALCSIAQPARLICTLSASREKPAAICDFAFRPCAPSLPASCPLDQCRHTVRFLILHGFDGFILPCVLAFAHECPFSVHAYCLPVISHPLQDVDYGEAKSFAARQISRPRATEYIDTGLHDRLPRLWPFCFFRPRCQNSPVKCKNWRGRLFTAAVYLSLTFP
jgi:hypothetical protein